MPDVVLTTLNAKYAHASFGLRYLMANLPAALRGRVEMLEFDVSQRPVDLIEAILARSPQIVGVGVYIWNAMESLRLVADLKRVRPDVIVILGGPEVSYETEQQEIVGLADYVIIGEGDLAFGELCLKVLEGKRALQKVIAAQLPEFTSSNAGGLQSAGFLTLPYSLYTDHDLARRVVYVEASRGCPFKCEFCLSSLDVPVRNAPIGAFLAEMQKLLDRGLRQFKFVDRTFNLNLNFSRAILQFFLDRWIDGLFLHFEMIPDRLPEALRALIAQFPPGALQFEVGIQTFNTMVSDRISRRQDNAKVADNLRFLREQSGVHVHADLIVGLPGEGMESFGEGFDRLVSLGPQEIQVGMLKRLRGTSIVRHDGEFGMIYSPSAPYEVLQT
ncbi:MAG: radical SAM protein, partial [Tepidisphaeraceae bacterium]